MCLSLASMTAPPDAWFGPAGLDSLCCIAVGAKKLFTLWLTRLGGCVFFRGSALSYLTPIEVGLGPLMFCEESTKLAWCDFCG